MKPLLLLLISLFVSHFTAAQTSPEAVQSFRLANGMSLIVKPDRRAPTVVHMLWVRVGSVDEQDGNSGLAHVLEHMLFKGTPSLGVGEYSRRVAAMGGQENAFTTRDATVYHQQIPKARLGDLMRLEADRFANNQWSDEEFAKEIKVVKEERRSRIDDNPRGQLWEQLSAVSLMASPYRRPVIGWMNDIDNLRPDDVRAFYKRWYVPANAAVVVVGDVDAKEVLRLAEQHYGAMAAGAVPSSKPQTEPTQNGPRRLVHKAVAEQTYVALDFKVPHLQTLQDSEKNQDALALTVLAAVLSGYNGARLERNLAQGSARVADSVGASNGLFGRGPQSFVLDGVPAPGKSAAQLEAALRAQVAQIARQGVSEAELARVKTQWVAGEIYKKDSVFNQANELGSYWMLGLPLDASEQVIERLRRITRAQVQAVAKKYFGEDQMSVGILAPQPAKSPAANASTQSPPNIKPPAP
jgi:zinc protease